MRLPAADKDAKKETPPQTYLCHTKTCRWQRAIAFSAVALLLKREGKRGKLSFPIGLKVLCQTENV